MAYELAPVSAIELESISLIRAAEATMERAREANDYNQTNEAKSAIRSVVKLLSTQRLTTSEAARAWELANFVDVLRSNY